MNNRGFTLVELLVALGIGTVLLFSTVGGIYMVVTGVPILRTNVASLADMDSAVHWITRDVMMGLTSNLADGGPPVTQMTIDWIDYTKEATLDPSIEHSITYTYNGTELYRNYDGAVTLVARHITDVQFSLNGRIITIILTAAVDGDLDSAVTREFKILMRGESGL